MGFEVNNIVVNCFDVVIFSVLGIFILAFLFLFSKMAKKKFPKLSTKSFSIIKSFVFGIPIRFLLEFYILVLISAIVSILDYYQSLTNLLLPLTLSVLILVSYLLFTFSAFYFPD